MANKALLFGDGDSFIKIMETTNPIFMKKYGRGVENFDQKIWDDYKFDIVVHGNRMKFEQNPLLMKRLLKTKDKIIVEAVPRDKIQGIGLSITKAINTPENKWPGKNLLGKALMKVRDENIK